MELALHVLLCSNYGFGGVECAPQVMRKVLWIHCAIQHGKKLQLVLVGKDDGDMRAQLKHSCHWRCLIAKVCKSVKEWRRVLSIKYFVQVSLCLQGSGAVRWRHTKTVPKNYISYRGPQKDPVQWNIQIVSNPYQDDVNVSIFSGGLTWYVHDSRHRSGFPPWHREAPTAALRATTGHRGGLAEVRFGNIMGMGCMGKNCSPSKQCMFFEFVRLPPCQWPMKVWIQEWNSLTAHVF